MIIITLIIGLIAGLLLGSYSCSSLEDTYYQSIEVSSEIDRLHSIIDGKDNQIGVLNSALGFMENGGHIIVNVLAVNYEEKQIQLKVENRLQTQVEVNSIGIIRDYAYSEGWLEDYSDDASGLIPVGGSKVLIWNESEAQALDLDYDSGNIVLSNSTNSEDLLYQTIFSENQNYIVRVNCGEGIWYYTKIINDVI